MKDRNQPEDLRAIPRSTRIYAQNRSLGVVVFLALFMLLSFVTFGFSYLAGEAWRGGQTLLLGACLVVLLFAFAAIIYFSVPRWGGKLVERISQRLYASEGEVALAPARRKMPPGSALLGVAFGGCVMATVALGFAGHIPLDYMQPVSAVYMVPFMVTLFLLQRPALGFLALLWPALYAVHAILIVAGAPILFTGKWVSLNMVIPVAGYGILSALIAHLRSRFALGKLRRLAGAGSVNGVNGGEAFR